MEQVMPFFLKIFSVSVARYFIVAGIPFFIFYKLLGKKMMPAKIQEKAASRADMLREVWHSMQTTVVFAIIACLVFLTPLKHITQVYNQISDYPAWWLWASIPLSLVVHDTYFYWMHRLLHHPRLFRYTHLVHHQSTNPSPWASYSFHFIEAWTEGLALLVIVMVMPMHAFSIGLFVLFGFVINVYGHLGYEIAPLWLRHTFLFEVLNTSVYHNFHHSKFKGNYGLYFRIWDRVMGTEHPNYVQEYDRIQASRVANRKAVV